MFSNYTMRYLKRSASICVLLLVLGACGQRGPLYLPEQKPQENQSPQTPSSDTSEGQSE